MTLAEVSARLDRLGIPHAVIGALALSVHGVVRASNDVDVFVTDRRCLDPAIWNAATKTGTVEIQLGEADDPLAGVVRLTPTAGSPIDVVVGRTGWQADLLQRAPRTPLLGASIPVATPTDLVLLKLFAGGPQDAWDIDQLLDAVPEIQPLVPASLDALPEECTALWQRILDGRSA